MTIIERRIVEQDWYETECSKTGWDSHGWFFKDNRDTIGNSWTVVKHLEHDKHYHPIIGIAEREVTL